MAARTHSYAQPRRSSPRATLAVLCGVVAVAAIPLAIEATRKMTGAVLLDAAWAIPVAALAAAAALMFERGARGAAGRTLAQTKGSRRLLAARGLAMTGVCLVLSSSLAVAIYEFLLWKEH